MRRTVDDDNDELVRAWMGERVDQHGGSSVYLEAAELKTWEEIEAGLKNADDYWDVLVGKHAETFENLGDAFRYVRWRWHEVDNEGGTIRLVRHKKGELA